MSQMSAVRTGDEGGTEEVDTEAKGKTDDDDDLGTPPADCTLGLSQILTHNLGVRGWSPTGDTSCSRAPDVTSDKTSEGPPRELEVHDPRHRSAPTSAAGQPYHALSGS